MYDYSINTRADSAIKVNLHDFIIIVIIMSLNDGMAL